MNAHQAKKRRQKMARRRENETDRILSRDAEAPAFPPPPTPPKFDGVAVFTDPITSAPHPAWDDDGEPLSKYELEFISSRCTSIEMTYDALDPDEERERWSVPRDEDTLGPGPIYSVEFESDDGRSGAGFTSNAGALRRHFKSQPELRHR